MVASSEDRTRDLVLTRHMLCQLSYRGDPEDKEVLAWEQRTGGYATIMIFPPWGRLNKKVCIDADAAA